MNNAAAIILAAGNGSRMKSKHPKVLCDVLFQPMISWVLDCCTQMEIPSVCAVVAPEHPLTEVLPPWVHRAFQMERLGTGHAVMAATDFIEQNKDSDILILFGDSPLMKSSSLEKAWELHHKEKNTLTLLSTFVDDPLGYGRIVRQEGRFSQIVEQRDTTPATAQIKEINSGALWAKASFLLQVLPLLQNHNSQKEYYLTDIAEIAVKQSLPVGVSIVEDSRSVLGANHRKALAELNEIARQQVLERLYAQGVHIPFPQSVVVAPRVSVGCDTTLMPNTIIRGNTTIGEDCVIGENTTLDNCTVGCGTTILSSTLTDCAVGSGVKIGPYVHIRPKSVIGDHVKLGNFVEIKASTLEEHTSVSHLSYLGDSIVGRYVNVGCGVVTANYDGEKKHTTIIGDSVFVGCNTNFIAPVTVGQGAVIAAGSTVTEEVPPFALAIARSRQINIPNWAKQNGKYKKGLSPV